MSKVTTKEFNKIKKLQELGLKNIQIAKIVDRGDSTISQLIRFESLGEYRKWNRARLATDKAAKAPKAKPAEQGQLNLVNNDEKIINTLAGLAEAVNRLADVIESSKPLAKEAKGFKLFGERV